jgi:transmembrane sensor
VERAGRNAFLHSRWFRIVAAGAAVVAIALISVPAILRPARAPTQAVTRLTPVESSMGAGDVNTIALSDGSVIRTGASTRLEFPAAENRREVVLEGRAFFAVARAPTSFVVRTRVGTTTVRGTRFEIAMEGDELRLVVVEGSVRLEGDAGETDVLAGHVAWLRNGSPPRVVARDDVWELLDWSGGLMIFQETPLADVAREVGRHFGRSVHITDEEIAGRRITAWFGEESIDEVVSAVCMIAGAHCSLGDTAITIER